MFSFYKKHNNKLYNKLTELSRNKFFYNDTKLLDNFQTRVLLIFFHLYILQIYQLKTKDTVNCLKVFKSNNTLGFLVFLSLIIGKLNL